MLAILSADQFKTASTVYSETLQNMSALVLVFVVVIVVLLLMGFLVYKLALRFLNDTKEQNNLERASHKDDIKLLIAGIDKLVTNSEKCNEDTRSQIIRAINASNKQIIEGQKIVQEGQKVLQDMIRIHDERVSVIEKFVEISLSKNMEDHKNV